LSIGNTAGLLQNQNSRSRQLGPLFKQANTHIPHQ